MVRSIFSFAGLLGLAATISAAPLDSETRDYVVVGGGPAGFVVAEYLSRDPKTTVTLLETGPDGRDVPLLQTPAYFFQSQKYMWRYHGKPDPNIGGRRPNVWQGRAFGGGSAVNAMFYSRSAKSVYNEWADISGNPGIAWDSLLDDFKETTHLKFTPANYSQPTPAKYFGNGPLEITRQRENLEMDIPFAKVLEDRLNIPYMNGVDGKNIGVGLGLETIWADNRTRCYAPNTFGYIAQVRPNVQLLHNAWATKINFSGETAETVTYNDTTTGKLHTIAGKEIILANGAINTPQLLMLSGVGPKNELDKHNIPVVADIPGIGANLYDHHLSVMQFKATKNLTTLWQFTVNKTGTAIAQKEYKKNGDGPLGANTGDVFGAIRLPDSIFKAINNTYYPSLPKDRAQVYYQYTGTPFLTNSPNESILGAFVAVVQPEASGHVGLNSADYRDPPAIYPNYYGSEGDKVAIQYGYKQLREIMNNDKRFKPYIAKELFPGPDVKTDEQVWKAIQDGAFSYHHVLGTAALGKVLDPNWRIKGLKNIRVVGAAAFPFPPSSPPQATVYAMAHRAAKDIAKADSAKQD